MVDGQQHAGSAMKASNSSRTILRALAVIAHHAVVPVQVVVQEALERVGFGAHALARSAISGGACAHVVDATAARRRDARSAFIASDRPSAY